MKKLFIVLLAAAFFTACSSGTHQDGAQKTSPTPNVADTPTAQSNLPDTKNEVLTKAKEVIHALKTKDMEKLSSLVHPKKGIRFSPYGHVEINSDLTFDPSQIKELYNDTTTRIWGLYDGIGEPIALDFKSYYEKFVYDVDFQAAPQVSFNEPLGNGNSINNAKDIYPEANIVEYYFPGIEPQYEGLDWRSLRLVFEREDDQWFLLGIIHDQWTI